MKARSPLEKCRFARPLLFDNNFNPEIIGINMKSIGEIEQDLANKAEPVLGFKPSSKFKRGPIGILIYVICAIIALISLYSAGVI